MAEIKVYSTPGCPWCHKLKEWLKEKKIEFKDVNVAEDQQAAQYIVEKSGQMGVPQTEINGKIIVGFDKDALEKELADKNRGKEKEKEEIDSSDVTDQEEAEEK